MAEFKAGDRVVKMSGIGAGKYGTVNSVMDNGTLNVTFDGEKIPRFCDPMRCGQVATNATFKKGDRVRLKSGKITGTVVGGKGTYISAGSLGGGTDYPEDVTVRWDSYSFDTPVKPENLVFANSRAVNAAPSGLTQTTKLRLKEDFTDEYGSYKKGSVFPMYAMGGINPRFGTMVVPGRGVTLQIPWEKLEVVNAVARNAGRFELVEHDMGRSFGVYDSATSGYIADDIPLRDALRILKTKGETAEQIKKNLEWVSPSAVDKLW